MNDLIRAMDVALKDQVVEVVRTGYESIKEDNPDIAEQLKREVLQVLGVGESNEA